MTAGEGNWIPASPVWRMKFDVPSRLERINGFFDAGEGFRGNHAGQAIFMRSKPEPDSPKRSRRQSRRGLVPA